MATSLPMAPEGQKQRIEGVPSVHGYLRYQLPKVPRQVRLEIVNACNNHCPWCLPGDEEVLTAVGLKLASKITVGDLVLSHEGRWKPVDQIMSRQFSGDLLNLKIKRGTSLRVTSEHPLLTPDGWKDAGALTTTDKLVTPALLASDITEIDLSKEAIDLQTRAWTNPASKEAIAVARQLIADGVRDVDVSRATGIGRSTASNIRSDRFIATKRLQASLLSDNKSIWTQASKVRINRFIQLTPEVLYVLGLYVAEGHDSIPRRRPNSGDVIFSFGKHETGLAARVLACMRREFGVNAVLEKERRTSISVRCGSGLLAKIFRGWFGHGASNKRFPQWVLELDSLRLWHFLNGYLAGDGYAWRLGNKAGTVSKTLAHQLQLCAVSLGVPSSISASKARTRTIEDRRVRTKPYYSVSLGQAIHIPPPEKHSRQSRWSAIRAIEREPYSGLVYNFSVGEDHSFVAGLVATHNCHGFGGSNPVVPGGKQMTRPRVRMPIEIIEQAVKEIATWPVPLQEITFNNYTEVLLYGPQWFEAMQPVDKYIPKTHFILVTTGNMFTEAHLEKLATLKTLWWVNFSVNAYFQETYERIHGVSAKALQRLPILVQKLRDMRPDVQIHASMVYDTTLVTEREREEFIAYWSGRVTAVDIQNPSFAGNPMRGPSEVVTLPCRSIYDGITVLSDGTCLPNCCFSADAEPELQIGHYPEEALLDIWRGGKLKNLAELHNSGRRGELALCETCTFA